MYQDFLVSLSEMIKDDSQKKDKHDLQITYSASAIEGMFVEVGFCKVLTKFIVRAIRDRKFVNIYLVVSMCRQHVYGIDKAVKLPIATQETKAAWVKVQELSKKEAGELVKICRNLEKIYEV